MRACFKRWSSTVMVKFAMVCLPPVLHGFSVTQDRRGYSIIKADSLHTAVGLAAGCPVLPTKMKPQNAVVTPWENSRKPRMRTPTGGCRAWPVAHEGRPPPDQTARRRTRSSHSDVAPGNDRPLPRRVIDAAHRLSAGGRTARLG